MPTVASKSGRYPESVISIDKDVILLFYRRRGGWGDNGTNHDDTSISSTRSHQPAPIMFTNFFHRRNKVYPRNSEVQEAHGDLVSRFDMNQHEQDTDKTLKKSTPRNLIRHQDDDSRTRDDFDVQSTNRRCMIHATTQTEGNQSVGHTYNTYLTVDQFFGSVFMGDQNGSTVSLQNNVDDESFV